MNHTFMIDASGSMGQPMPDGNNVKINVAKEQIVRLVDKLAICRGTGR